MFIYLVSCFFGVHFLLCLVWIKRSKSDVTSCWIMLALVLHSYTAKGKAAHSA